MRQIPDGAQKSPELPLVFSLHYVSKKDVETAGGKAASLGEMLNGGIPVPPGFVVSSQAYREFLKESALDSLINGLMENLDMDNPSEIERTALQVQKAITTAIMPLRMVLMINGQYQSMGLGTVAVRSSATAEDLENASFAGQQQSFLNVEGCEAVVEAVQACWASLYQSRAIFYRHAKGFDQVNVAMSVVVQRMAPAAASGVMFTVDPSSNDKGNILIEAIYGLGEPLVSGALSPDAYKVRKGDYEIVFREHARQPWYLKRRASRGQFDEGCEQCAVPPALQEHPKLTDRQIKALAALGARIEHFYGSPQDVEWAIAEDEIYILQSRPITTLDSVPTTPPPRETDMKPKISGAAASPGVGTGAAGIIHSPKEIHLIREGDVLVTEMTTPDFVHAMKRASAIITDRGGRTCHAAIVSREMGIPCVVGTKNATQKLTSGETVTVDGASGHVYEGDVSGQLARPEEMTESGERLQTRTKLYVNLADPDSAERVSKLDTDGVGLLRAEFVMTHIGEHPKAMLAEGRGAEFTNRLAGGLETFARAFHPRPVVYRFSDFKTNEYRNLRGGEAHEGQEENPMLGYRGCARYLSEPEVFALEARAVRQVRAKWDNLWLMLPFVRTAAELKDCKDLLGKFGLASGPNLRLWMMLEVPSNVILLDDFLDVGIDGVSIGSNDLTQLMLGVDRDNERLASQFDERDPAVLEALKRIVTGCAARGVTVSICGQAPSVYPEITRLLVSWGISSISVTPDMISTTRRAIYEAEGRAGSKSNEKVMAELE
jgi:pyruvate,water dikinase